MSLLRTFHPVGQGAFYTEQHYEGQEVLTVVYDCGSLTANKEQFQRKVATALPPKSVIDLLFLSHFHADHVNGLDELKDRYTIRTVVLPELTEEARVLVKLENYLEYAGFSTALIDDPQAYFGHKTVIIQIEAIRGDSPGADNNVDNPDALAIELPAADQADEPIVPPGIVTRTQKRMRTVPSGTPIRLRTTQASFWEYVPYNYEFAGRRSEFLRLLETVGIELTALRTLEQVLDNQKILARTYKQLDGDLNENSLVVYSGALTAQVRLLHKGPPCACWHHFYYEAVKPGCLYLGDADLSVPFIVPDLRKRLGDRWQTIQTIQVPHHGAVKNFNPAIVAAGMQAVISFGTTNTYGHPSAYVIGQLHRLHANPVLVTEHLETGLYSHATH
ncbi:MAG: MBL fold metallo-hydrolase [Janthinobacterium lividum]